MQKRESLNTTNTPKKPGKSFHDIGDAQSVDTGQNLLTLLWKCGWLITVTTASVIVILKLIFPSFVDEHATVFSQLSASHWADRAIGLAREGGIRNVKWVGTGRHPHFKDHPEDKARFFFDSEVLMMKNYFTNQDKLELEGNLIKQIGITDIPITDIEQDEAQELCERIGARLPYYMELRRGESICQQHGRNLIKPNLAGCKFNPDKRMWTATAEAGLIFGDSDNFRIYQPGSEGIKGGFPVESRSPEYQDDGFESGNIGFRCVKDVQERQDAINQ